MPILGMVLVLDDATPATRRAVAEALAREPDLALGEPAAHRWPVVLESPDPHAAESRIDGLRGFPGHAGVDVVYANFEDMLERPSPAAAREES
jgi:hypothetical protein